MSRWILGVSLLFILPAAEQTSGCGDMVVDPDMEGVPDLADADAALEFSLLQKSLTLQRDQELFPHSSRPRPSLFSAFEFAIGWGGNATSTLNASTPLALMSLVSSTATQRTRDIIAWPGACVLSLSFVVTLIFVVVLWAVMLEANQATKLATRHLNAGAGPEDPRVPTKSGRFEAGPEPGLLPQFGADVPTAPAPPICERLILPHGAAQFRIPLEALDRLRAGTFPVPILGLSGRQPLLHAWLPLCTKTPRGTAQGHGQSQIGHLLQLTTTPATRHPHASIGLLHLGAMAQRAPTEIFGPSNQKYGSMTRSNDKWQVHHHSDGSEQLVMTMRTSTAFLGFSAYAPDGRQLASATRISLNGGPNADTLAISASPGTDALLALLCILAVVLSMMEKVPPPSEATTESAAPAYNLPPGYEDVTQPKPTSRASLPEGRQMPSRPRVSFTHSAPASAQSLPSPGFSQSAQGTTPKSTPSLPPTDTAFLPRSDHAPQPRELPSSGVRPGVQTSLPIYPPLGTNPQQPQQPRQPPRSGPVFRG